MNIKLLVAKALDKGNFKTLDGYIDFAKHYLDFIDKHLQAVFVSQNENHYQFYQYVSGKRREPTLTRDNKIKFDNNEEPNFNNFDTCDNLFTWFRF